MAAKKIGKRSSGDAAERFASLVKSSGSPEVLLVWENPKKNELLQKAIRENRLLTVLHGSSRSGKDQGIVGFYLKPASVYYVFPIPLTVPSGTPIIGMDYELVATPLDTAPRKERIKKKAVAKKSFFVVEVQCSYRVTRSFRLEAESKKMASRAALEKVNECNNIPEEFVAVSRKIVEIRIEK